MAESLRPDSALGSPLLRCGGESEALNALVHSPGTAPASESVAQAASVYKEAPAWVPHVSRPTLRGPGLNPASRLQWYIPPKRPYSRRELLADRAVNFAGAALSWPCAAVLGYLIWRYEPPRSQQFCYIMHGVGLVAMLNLSALYHHMSWNWEQSYVYSSLDQVGINSMIVGCFAPFLIAVEGYIVMSIVCALGGVGVTLQALRLSKLTAKLKPISKRKDARWTIIDWINVFHYVLMGLMTLPDLPWLIEFLPSGMLDGYLVGGLLYLAGVPFLLFERMEFHQAFWHLFVLVASACIYAAIVTQALHAEQTQLLE